MKRFFPPLLQAAIIGLLVTAYLNAGLLREIAVSGTWNASVQANLMTQDETRYTSRIRSVMDGRMLVGNPNLKEHADGIAPGGLSEWAVALPARAFRWSLPTAIAATDLLFPALVAAGTWWWLRRALGGGIAAAAALSCLLLLHWDAPGGLLRESAPKTAMLFSTAYLCAVFARPRREVAGWLLRGALIGLMFSTYLYHWTWFIVFEAAWLAYDWLVARRPFRSLLPRAAAVFGAFAVFAVPAALLLRSMVDPDLVAVTAQHFGLISTRFPAAPTLSLKLLLSLGALAVAYRLKPSREALLVGLLIAAGIVAVNSNVITGKEAEFLGHYDRVLFVAYVPAFFFLARGLLPVRAFVPATGLVGLAAAAVLGSHVPAILAYSTDASARAAGNAEILSWVDALPDEIPALTDKHVFMNDAAHFFFVPEAELAERYVAHLYFFPEDAQPTDEGTMAVFGNYPGQIRSKTRAVQKLFRPSAPFERTQADFIIDQDLRRAIDAAIAAPEETAARKALSAYRLDYLVTPGDAAPPADLFVPAGTVGAYRVYAFTGGR